MALIFKRRIATPAPAVAVPDSPLVPTEQLDSFTTQVYAYLKTVLTHHEAHAVWLAGQRIHDLNQRALFYSTVVQTLEEHEATGVPSRQLDHFSIYERQPVDIRTFICDPYYLDKAQEIYPLVLEEAAKLNSGDYTEAVMTGGIGSGKTTLALYTNAYQLYLLSCMRSPHRQFGLDPASEIIFIFQSITKHLAQGVDYQRFRSMIETSPYFKEKFPFEKGLLSKLVFPNRIEVAPVSGSETAAIGQNVIGGLIDELNYMAVVEKSKSSVDKGTYDQAVAVYNSIARRRKSRFMENGKLPGILCLVSSKKYPGQFTDQKMEEAKRDKTIFIYDKRVWDIKPDSFGKAGWFHVFVGDMTRKPRILGDDEPLSAEDRQTLVIEVPEEFREEFSKDIINALREIAGVSTLARHPYFLEVDKVSQAFHAELPSIFSQSPVDFVDTRLTLIKKAFFKPHLPRFVHVDLAISGDSAGLAIGTVDKFVEVSIDPTRPAFMPHIHIDGVLEVRPPKNSEILFSKIRDVIRVLRNMGLTIKWVTFDQFQSTDSQQILRQQGLVTGHQSIDELPCKPYAYTKTAMYEHRLRIPHHPHLQREILMLERDAKTGRIDHPPDGSKDCADALAGVVYGLTMRREIWILHNIPLMMIPEGASLQPDKLKGAESQKDYQDEETLLLHSDYTRARLKMGDDIKELTPQ